MSEGAAARPVTHARVLGIALPVVAANITVPLLGLVDTGVVGQLGRPEPIAAVGIGAVVLTSIYWIFGFLRMGTAGLTAQAHGAQNSGEVAALLVRSLMIGALGGVAIIALQRPLFYAAFAVSPASAEIEALARTYMEIRVWSAPALIAGYGISGWLIGVERTRAYMAVLVVMNALNIALDFLFVTQFGWGVRGVAIATVIAEWSGLALGLWLCRAAFRHPSWRDWPRVFDRLRLGRMARVNSDILIRSALLQGMIVAFMFLGARFDPAALAANQVLLQFLHITAYGLDGFAFGAETLVGQAIGAKNASALRRAARLSGLWGAGVVALMAVSFAGFGGALIDLMTTAPLVREAARDFLPWMIAAPLVGWAPWMLDGIFIGATRTREMRNMMAVSVLVYGAAIAILMPVFGNHGLWGALLISYGARGATLWRLYPRVVSDAS